MGTKNHFLKIALFMFVFVSFFSCKNETPKTEKTEEEQPYKTVSEDPVERGKYLVNVMGCNDCHSPKKMGPKGPEVIPELMLSGFPSDRPMVKFDSPLIKQGFAMFYPDLTGAAGPWGVSFAANLTPDETGLGSWTEEQFKKALTQGKFKGLDNSRMLLPPMPWFDFAHLKDEDVSAIFAYLKTLKPVKNLVPAPIAPDKM